MAASIHNLVDRYILFLDALTLKLSIIIIIIIINISLTDLPEKILLTARTTKN